MSDGSRSKTVICRWCNITMKSRMLARHLRQRCKVRPEIPSGYYPCSHCQEIKPISEFPKSTSTYKTRGHGNMCGACNAAAIRIWVAKVKSGEHIPSAEKRERPGGWVLAPCKHCGDMFRARQMHAHAARCPKKPPNRYKIASVPKERIVVNPEEIKAKKIANRKRSERHGNLVKKYGIGIPVFDQMFAAQDGKCGCCGLPPLKTHQRNQTLHVDHDHKTGAIRELLCNACNHGFGFFKDDIGLLLKAIDYLRRHSKIAIVS